MWSTSDHFNMFVAHYKMLSSVYITINMVYTNIPPFNSIYFIKWRNCKLCVFFGNIFTFKLETGCHMYTPLIPFVFGLKVMNCQRVWNVYLRQHYMGKSFPSRLSHLLLRMYICRICNIFHYNMWAFKRQHLVVWDYRSMTDKCLLFTLLDIKKNNIMHCSFILTRSMFLS